MSIVYFIDWVHFLVRVDHYYVPRPLKIKVFFFFGWRRPSVRTTICLSVDTIGVIIGHGNVRFPLVDKEACNLLLVVDGFN
jgi:hypothetical protein